jgi:hypothetical protein
MLSITPVVVQPFQIVDSVLRMFRGEFTTNSIEIENMLDQNYQANKVDWVS